MKFIKQFLTFICIALLFRSSQQMSHKLATKIKNTLQSRVNSRQVMTSQRIEHYVTQEQLNLGVEEYNTQYWESIDISKQNQVTWIKFYFNQPSAESSEKFIVERSDLDLKPEFKYILDYCVQQNDVRAAIKSTKGVVPECYNPTIPEKPQNPDAPGAPAVEEGKKQEMLLKYQEYQASPMYNAFAPPNGYLLTKYCKIRSRCFNSAFVRLLSHTVIEVLEASGVHLGCLRMENIYYDLDDDKFVFVNLYDNPKPIPATMIKQTQKDDFVDLGILLTQILMRNPKDSREALIEDLRKVITVNQLYAIIHGNDPKPDANFHATIYELIMRCFGNNIMIDSNSPQFSDAAQAKGDSYFSTSNSVSQRASDLGADFDEIDYLG